MSKGSRSTWKKWKEKFRAAIKPECGGLRARVQVVQQCDECQQPLQKLHHKCSGAALAKAEALRESPPASPTTRGQVRSREEDGAGTSMEPAAKKPGPLDSFTVKLAELEQVHRLPEISPTCHCRTETALNACYNSSCGAYLVSMVAHPHRSLQQPLH